MRLQESLRKMMPRRCPPCRGWTEKNRYDIIGIAAEQKSSTSSGLAKGQLLWISFCWFSPPFDTFCLLNFHGGIGFGCDHKPFFDERASFSASLRSISFGAYRLYHHANPSATIIWFRYLPSMYIFANSLLYWSFSTGTTSTVFPKTLSEVNCLALGVCRT